MALPDHTTQDDATYKSNIDLEMARRMAFVPLPVPVRFLNISSLATTWTLFDSSASAVQEIVDAFDAGAIIFEVEIYHFHSHNALAGSIFATQPAGQGEITSSEEVTRSRLHLTPETGTVALKSKTSHKIYLDANSDFDYYFNFAGTSTLQLYLVGYWAF